MSQVEGFRLSPQQRQLWRLHGGEPRVGAFARVAVTGPLDVDALRGAVDRLAARFEILRTTFPLLPGMDVPVQVIGDRADAVFEAEAFADVPQCIERVGAFASRNADRFGVLVGTFAPDRHVVVLALPAMCADSAGLVNTVVQLVAEYGGQVADDGEEPMQYADLAEWQNELLEEGEGQAFDGGVDGAGLPMLRPAGAIELPSVARIEIANETVTAAETLASSAGVSAAAVWLAGWQALLGRLTDEPLTLGIACDGRSYEGLDVALGAFVRDLPLVGSVSRDASLTDLAGAADAALGELQERQEYFVWDRVNGSRRPATEGFAVGFACEDQGRELVAGSVTFAIEECLGGAFRCGLRLVAAQRHGGWSLELHHDRQRCSAEDAQRLAAQFARLLTQALARPDASLREFDIVGDEERERLLVGFNDTAAEVAVDRCIHELIRGHAEKTPDALAGVCGEQKITYRELVERAQAIAGVLAARGVRPDSMVGVCADRSVDMLVAILAVHLAGGAYVPIDPAYPADRIAFMLEDTAAPVVLAQQHLASVLAEHSTEVVFVDGELPGDPAEPVAADLDHLAYVIYTSGSTGKPKGVEITHRNLMHSTLARGGTYDHAPGIYLLLSSFAFDSSVPGIFWTLASGGTVALPAVGLDRDLHEIARVIRECGVTHTLALPSLYAVLLRETGGDGLGSLNTVIVAGEACPRDLVELHAETVPGAALFNEYGPTEGTVWATVHRCQAGGPERVPIGRPIQNARAYIVDEALRPVPIGVPGELYLGGPGIARGYLNRPELTAERFVEDPFGSGERLYRTGDLVRYLDDGAIEFLGRVDNQVKIRGYRIELEEVEGVLGGAPGVEEAVVVAQLEGDPMLVAYVLAESGVDVEGLRAHVAERLPEYMVPAAITVMDSLPRMPNGKVDRAALSALRATRDDAAEYVAPRTPVETALAGMWSELLGADRIGVHDNFFRLGGHSLLVTQLIFRLREAFAAEVSLRAIFDRPTVAELADYLLEDAAQRSRIEAVAADLTSSHAEKDPAS